MKRQDGCGGGVLILVGVVHMTIIQSFKVDESVILNIISYCAFLRETFLRLSKLQPQSFKTKSRLMHD